MPKMKKTTPVKYKKMKEAVKVKRRGRPPAKKKSPIRKVKVIARKLRGGLLHVGERYGFVMPFHPTIKGNFVAMQGDDILISNVVVEQTELSGYDQIQDFLGTEFAEAVIPRDEVKVIYLVGE